MRATLRARDLDGQLVTVLKVYYDADGLERVKVRKGRKGRKVEDVPVSWLTWLS